MESMQSTASDFLGNLNYTKALLLLLGTHLFIKSMRSLHWSYHNKKLEARARAIVEAKESKRHEFKHIDNVKVEVILNMDVAQLREGLLKNEFTSEDLVHIFAKRCYTIGR